MKNTVMFIVFMLVVVGSLYAISGRKYSRMPADASHLGLADTTLCMECHGPGKQYPQKISHPPKPECLKCHKHKRTKKSSS